jgi:hypothetical protein
MNSATRWRERGFGDTIPLAMIRLPFFVGKGRLLFFAAITLVAAGHPIASWAATEAGAMPPPPQQSTEIESPIPVFELHSGFWVNLHHFLYLQARLKMGGAASLDTGRGAAAPNEPAVSLIGFPAEEIAAWQSAVAYYEKDLAGRDLLLNVDMENINNRLAELETCADLAGHSSSECTSGLKPELVQALDRAAPVYRAHWWPAHDRANREWIARVAPMVQQMGVELSGQLAEVYQRPWPPGRLHVDVVWYGGPYGAYTSLNPIHVTISSQDARDQDIYAFEVLFHESSHALATGVTDAISREFRARDKPIPRDLWHALLFYTTGELVRRDLAEGTITFASVDAPDPSQYQPYAARFGLYSGGWEQFLALLDLYWRPYLDGKVSFDRAIAQLADEQ